MSGNLSPIAQQKLAQLEIYAPRVQHLHTLVETFAAAKTNQGTLIAAIKRAADTLKLSFMTAGLEQMSQTCNAVWMVAHRGGTQSTRTRTFREHVGTLKFQMELEARTILREDKERRAKEDKARLQS